MAEYTIEQLTNAYKEANRDLLSSLPKPSSIPSGGGGMPSGGGGSSWNPLTGAADVAATAIKKLGENSGYAAGALDVLTSVSKKIPMVGDAFSKVAGVLGETAIKGSENIQKGMQFGNLNQDMGLLAKNVGGSRMTMDEWNNSMRRGSDVMTSMGSTVTRGTQGFATLTKELQESPLGTELTRAGWLNKDLNDVLMVSAKNQKNLNLSDAASRQQLINSAGELAVKIQEVSAATGQDKAAILDKLEAEKKDAQLVVARQSMEPAQRAAFDSFRTSLQKLGPEAMELGKAFATGGVRTKEQQAIFSAMGNLGPELQRVQKLQMEASKDPSKKADAEAAQRNFEARYYQYLQSSSVKQRVQYDTSAAGDALRRMVVSGQEGVAAIQSGKVETPGATGAQVIARQKQETALALQGRGPDGKEIAGAQTARTIYAGEQASKDIAAGAGIRAKEFNDSINQSTGALGRFRENLDSAFKPRTAEESAKMVAKPVEIVGDAAKKLAPGGKAASTAMPAGYAGAASRANGSLGSVGKLIEDWGTESKVKLHGREGVITEQQLQDIISTARGSSSKDLATATMQNASQIIDNISAKMTGDAKDKSFNVKDMVENTKQLASQAKKVTSETSTPVSAKTERAPSIQPAIEIPKVPPVNTALITDQFKGMFSQVGQMQSSVTSKLAESKASAPSAVTLENIISKLSASPKTSKVEKTESAKPTAKAPDEATSEITKQLIGLNMRMERLIAEVSNSASKQVKATKGISGNRIAA